MPDWWDGIAQWVEDRKKDYEEIDKNLGGWLPGGAETQGDQVPFISGLENAQEQAAAPTDEGYNLWQLRDAPLGINLAMRGAEMGLNTFNQAFERGMKPYWGASQYDTPEETQWRNEEAQAQGLPGNERPIQNDPWGVQRFQKGWTALTGTPEQQEEGRQQYEKLSTARQVVGALADPVNFLPGPNLKGFKAAAEAAAAIKDISKLSLGERVLGNVPKMTREAAMAADVTQLSTQNPVAKVFGRFPILGDLLKLGPESKASELTAHTVDQALSRVVGAADEAELLGKLTDLKVGPTAEVLARAPGAASRDALEASKVLTTYSPVAAISDFKNAPAMKAELDAMKAAQAAGKVVNAKKLEALAEAVAKAPKSFPELQARVMAEVLDHAAGMSAKAYNIKEGGTFAQKAQNLHKAILGTIFIATNPGYPLVNVAGNVGQNVLNGVNPLIMNAYNRMVKSGFSSELMPFYAAKGIGMAGETGNFVSKLPPTKWAQAAERIQGKQAWITGFDKGRNQFITRLLGEKPLPPATQQALAAIDQRLPGMITNAMKSRGGTPAEVIKIINTLPGFKGTTGLPPLMGFLPEELQAVAPDMAAQVISRLEEKYGSITTKVDAQALFAQVRQDMVKFLEDGLARQAKGKAMAGPVEKAATRSPLDLATQYAKARGTAFADDAKIFASAGPMDAKIAEARQVWESAFVAMQAARQRASAVFRPLIGDEAWTKLDGTYQRLEDATMGYRDKLSRLHEVAGGDAAQFRAAKDLASIEYAKARQPLEAAINELTTDAYVQMAWKGQVPAEKVAMLTRYKAMLADPVPNAGEIMKAHWAKIHDMEARGAKADEIARAWDGYWASMGRKYKAADQQAEGVRKTLFGDLKSQTVMPGPKAAPPAPVAKAADVAHTPLSKLDPYTAMPFANTGAMADMLDLMEKGVLQYFDSPVQGQVPPEVRQAVYAYVKSLGGDLDVVRQGAMKMGDVFRNQSLLNYSHRYNYDTKLAWALPFHFWMTSNGKNTVARFVEHPGVFAAYYRMKEIANEAENKPGFPDRLKGMFRFNLPGAPDWMGDQFIDVTSKMLPLAQLEYLPRMLAFTKEEDLTPLDVIQSISSVTPFFTVPFNAFVLNKPEKIGPMLPLNRYVKAGSALYKEAGLPGGENIPMGGWDPEGALRQKAGLLEGGEFTEYTIERMVSNLAGTGDITADEAIKAMQMHSGPAWEKAKQRAAIESGMSTFIGGTMGLKTFPKGEELQRGENTELNKLVMDEASRVSGKQVTDSKQAWDIVKKAGLTKKGSGASIAQWYVDHPDYQARQFLTDTPEDRAAYPYWQTVAQSIPSKYKATLPAEEQAVLQKWWDVSGDLTKFTSTEKAALDSIKVKIEADSQKPEFQKLLTQGKERATLIDKAFADANGPTDVGDKRAWLKEHDLIKKGDPLYEWERANGDYFAETPSSAAYDVLSSIPSAYRKKLTEVENALVDKFFKVKGDMTKMTPVEQKRLQAVVDDLSILGGTESYKQQQAWGKELGALIHKVFSDNNGPEGVDEMQWIKDNQLNKKGSELYQWWQEHPNYGTAGAAASGTTSGTSTAGAGKDPVLYKEITDLIDSEFQRLGGPAGTTDKYGWIKQANGGKTTPAISKWYQDHPGYSSSPGSSGGSTYKPYTSYAKKPFTVYAGKEFSFFKKWAPKLVKALLAYFKTGKAAPDLAQQLYEVYMKNKETLLTPTFEAWVTALKEQSGA